MSHLLPKNWLDLTVRQIAHLAPLQQLDLPLAQEKGIRLSIKREDLLHPLVGGNKVYKLHGYLNDYRAKHPNSSQPVVTYGGAYSNHLLALAWATHSLGIPCIGVVRGESASFTHLSPTLQDCRKLGMHLHFVSRSEYRLRGTLEFELEQEAQFGPAYWIPEGGSGVLGAKGCIGLAQGIFDCTQAPVNVITHACGTGSSLAGMIAGVAGRAQVCGVSALKGYRKMEQDIQDLLDQMNTVETVDSSGWGVRHEFHGGGYGKFSEQISELINTFASHYNLLLDPVYTAKEMLGVLSLISQGVWEESTHIVMVHSGGLQGLRGYPSVSSLYGD